MDQIRYKLLQCVPNENIIKSTSTPIQVSDFKDILENLNKEFDESVKMNKVILKTTEFKQINDEVFLNDEVIFKKTTQKYSKLPTYDPDIKHPNDIHLDEKPISEFGKVYVNVCKELGVEFDLDDLEVYGEKSNVYNEYANYLSKYIYNSRDINQSLIENAISSKPINGNAKKLISVIKMYEKLYIKTIPHKSFENYKIYHVGQMMYNVHGKPCISSKSYNTLCFLSCSLVILNNWINNENINFPIIYEIEVDSTTPVFYLFDNSEVHECLLRPGTHLKMIKSTTMNYLGKECLIVKMKLL